MDDKLPTGTSFASAIEAIRSPAKPPSDEELQQLLMLAVKLYSARALELRAEGDEHLPAFPADSDMSATEAMMTASAMLKAVNVQIFELGMYQAWAGA